MGTIAEIVLAVRLVVLFGHRVLSHIAQGSSDTDVRLMFAPEGFAWNFECEVQLMLRH